MKLRVPTITVANRDIIMLSIMLLIIRNIRRPHRRAAGGHAARQQCARTLAARRTRAARRTGRPARRPPHTGRPPRRPPRATGGAARTRATVAVSDTLISVSI